MVAFSVTTENLPLGDLAAWDGHQHRTFRRALANGPLPLLAAGAATGAAAAAFFGASAAFFGASAAFSAFFATVNWGKSTADSATTDE